MEEIIKNATETTESAKLYEIAKQKIAAYAAACNDGKSKTELSGLKKSAYEALTAFNAQIAKERYMKWAEMGDPIRAALTVRTIDGAKKVSYKEDKKTGKTTATIKDATPNVDLIAMESAIGSTYFAHREWFKAIERFSALIEKHLNNGLEYVFDSVYTDDDIRTTLGISEDADLLSMKSITRGLQTCVDRILFVESENKAGNRVNKLKMESKHVSCIELSITERGDKPGEVEIHGATGMTDLIADMIYLALNGKKPSTNRVD